MEQEPFKIYSPGMKRDSRADCTVIALAYCWDLKYDEAHAILKKAGRKDNAGFHLRERLLGVGPFKKYRQFRNRGVSYHKNKYKKTARKFIAEHPTGRYLAFTRGHVFSLIDGVPHNVHELGSLVQYYIYVSPPFPVAAPARQLKTA